ncbi:uncharacterized protein F4822DRAFT_426869 [Hypoxylon trugodes]|uniref:uncharacterized protein n=1 Tax=Hypoxylon trugodes TaxID=326681 RepID=UPI00219913B0|nr:uncharacterized protein F4822DRAFT_426869 [Hypoxylon trugodes]KAI1391016.1 hypothetical protein F4822DRAFT_426869 [Hypoxylon trugodes]
MQVVSFTGEVFRLARSLRENGSLDPSLVSNTESLNRLLSTLNSELGSLDGIALPSDTSAEQQETDKESLKAQTRNLLQNVEKLQLIFKKSSNIVGDSTASRGESNEGISETNSSKVLTIISKGKSSIISKGKAISVILKYKFHYQSEIASLGENIDKAHAILNTGLLKRLCNSDAAEKARSDMAFAGLDRKLQRFIKLWSEGHRDISMLISAEAANARVHVTAEVSLLGNRMDEAEKSIKAYVDALHAAAICHNASVLSDDRELRGREELIARIFSTLWFDSMNKRENEIGSPDYEVNLVTEAEGAPTRLSQWLEAEDPIFWISGKPGSGKSSLMKFLVSDTRTKDHLNKWKPSKPHILEALLSRKPKLADKRSGNDWSIGELRDILLESFRLANSPICLFLDGLDEVAVKSDDRDSIINLIEQLGRLGNTKICASSRPENIFQDRFGSYPCLQTQDLNGPAIGLYIQKRLAKYKPSSPADLGHYQKLIRVLAEKASGVFLWVRLATNSVVDGIRNRDKWSTLYERTEKLEPDLDKFFSQMWDRQSSNAAFYKEDRERLLWYSLLVTVSEVLSTLLGYILGTHEDFRSNLLHYTVGAERITEEARIFEEYRKWLSARGAGLLEITKEPIRPIGLTDSSLLHYQVGFIHRSVQEFLLGTQAGHDILLATPNSSKQRLLRTTRAIKDICCYVGDVRFISSYAGFIFDMDCVGLITPQEEAEEFLDFRSRLQSRAPGAFPDYYFLDKAVECCNVEFLLQLREVEEFISRRQIYASIQSMRVQI